MAFIRRDAICMLFTRYCITSTFTPTRLQNLQGTTTNIGFYYQKNV